MTNSDDGYARYQTCVSEGMCEHVCLSVCLVATLEVKVPCVCVWGYVWTRVCVCLSVCLSARNAWGQGALCVCVRECVNTCVCLSVCLCVNRCVCLSGRNARGQGALRELLNPLVTSVVDDTSLQINTNPVEVYKLWINQTEAETGQTRSRLLQLAVILCSVFFTRFVLCVCSVIL